MLASWNVTTKRLADATHGAPQFPFGRQPVGLLIYSPDGYMSATVSAGDRTRFNAGASPRQLPAAALADAFISYFHYAGRWWVEGEEVLHRVEAALNPNMVDTTQVRHASLDGKRMLLTGIETLADRERRHEIAWRRAEATPAKRENEQSA
ncbi:MAG: lipocalin-like domain-containing protein [Pseudomonadota bacterium]